MHKATLTSLRVQNLSSLISQTRAQFYKLFAGVITYSTDVLLSQNGTCQFPAQEICMILSSMFMCDLQRISTDHNYHQDRVPVLCCAVYTHEFLVCYNPMIVNVIRQITDGKTVYGQMVKLPFAASAASVIVNCMSRGTMTKSIRDQTESRSVGCQGVFFIMNCDKKFGLRAALDKERLVFLWSTSSDESLPLQRILVPVPSATRILQTAPFYTVVESRRFLQ